MRIALVADTFPPLRTSGAVQLRDLSLEFVRQGHEVTVLVASAKLAEDHTIESYRGVRVMRIRTPVTKDVGYLRRTWGELVMPLVMRRTLEKSALAKVQWDGVVWYSPSIFFGPLIKHIKQRHGCPSYLIIRDIFPEWAVDMGLFGKGLPYLFFRTVADYQYSVADVIGVQSPGNSVYFKRWLARSNGRLEVLQNWLSEPENGSCPIRISETRLAGRKIFVYSGNMGIAQGVINIIGLAEEMRQRTDVGFVFVGRGSESRRIADEIARRGLENVLVFDEIDPDEIPDLYAQCSVGIVALDARHKTHNIPGKFISYMRSGLPVFALINPGNDLQAMMESSGVGVVSTSAEPGIMKARAEELLEQLGDREEMESRCRQLYSRLFTPQIAVDQIVRALQNQNRDIQSDDLHSKAKQAT